jgi:hypothetical protein
MSETRKPLDYFSHIVTPERFNRGSSPKFAWIPAKDMRE